MLKLLAHPIRLAGGMYELARLAIITRFAFGGPYWKWRMDTAFGRGKPRSRSARWQAVLEYGMWIRQMRKHS